MVYRVSLDLKSKIITVCCGVLFAGMTIYSIMSMNFQADDLTEPVVVLLSTILVLFIFIFCYLYRPLGYVVDCNKVIVKRPLKDLIIEFGDIKRAFLPTKESMKWTIRTFGNGGFFWILRKF
jgi:hypothetical protein